MPEYSQQVRDIKILELVEEYFESQLFADIDEKLAESKNIDEDYTVYTEIDEYKHNHSCVVLLNLVIEI